MRNQLFYNNTKKLILNRHVNLLFKVQKKKDTEKVDSKMLKTRNGRPFLSSKCAVCASKKNQNLQKSKRQIKTPLSKLPLLSDILF